MSIILILHELTRPLKVLQTVSTCPLKLLEDITPLLRYSFFRKVLNQICELLGLLISFLGVFVWSVINSKDIFTWFLEVLPAVIGLVIVLLTYNRFRLTNLVYGLIWIHAIILVVGGHYTYAEMPVFNWLRDTFDLARNYYDRLGHFAQGFIPAVIAREILLRKTPLRPMLFSAPRGMSGTPSGICSWH